MASTSPACLWWQVKQSTPLAACLLIFHSLTNAGDCDSWQATQAWPSLEIVLLGGAALAVFSLAVAPCAGAAHTAMPTNNAVSTAGSHVFPVMERLLPARGRDQPGIFSLHQKQTAANSASASVATMRRSPPIDAADRRVHPASFRGDCP